MNALPDMFFSFCCYFQMLMLFPNLLFSNFSSYFWHITHQTNYLYFKISISTTFNKCNLPTTKTPVYNIFLNSSDSEQTFLFNVHVSDLGCCLAFLLKISTHYPSQDSYSKGWDCKLLCLQSMLQYDESRSSLNPQICPATCPICVPGHLFYLAFWHFLL